MLACGVGGKGIFREVDEVDHGDILRYYGIASSEWGFRDFAPEGVTRTIMMVCCYRPGFKHHELIPSCYFILLYTCLFHKAHSTF